MIKKEYIARLLSYKQFSNNIGRNFREFSIISLLRNLLNSEPYVQHVTFGGKMNALYKYVQRRK